MRTKNFFFWFLTFLFSPSERDEGRNGHDRYLHIHNLVLHILHYRNSRYNSEEFPLAEDPSCSAILHWHPPLLLHTPYKKDSSYKRCGEAPHRDNNNECDGFAMRVESYELRSLPFCVSSQTGYKCSCCWSINFSASGLHSAPERYSVETSGEASSQSLSPAHCAALDV